MHVLSALAAQVGNTLFGNDDVDIMLAVVHMGNHRYDGADFAFFGYGRAGEDGDVALRVKSPEPPIPFIIFVPPIWVEFTFP